MVLKVIGEISDAETGRVLYKYILTNRKRQIWRKVKR